MISRRAAAAWALAWCSGLRAQEPAAVAERLILDASRALQGGNARRFLSYCDKQESADFFLLRENVTALIDQRVAASSVDLDIVEVKGSRVVFDVDWLLQLTWRREVGPVEQRQETIRAVVDVSGKKPKIVELRPIAFFGPGSP